MTACLHCCMSVCLHDCLAMLGQIPELFALGEMKMFKHEPFLMKNFGGQRSLYTIHNLKNDCDEKKKKHCFPGFKCPVDSIFEETQERFSEHIQIYNCYFKFIFDIGLDYCKFLRVVHV